MARPRHVAPAAAATTVAVIVGLALPASVPARASAVPRIEDGLVVRSWDGVPIVATLMLPTGASAAHPVPAVLHTHGWGGSRQRAPEGTAGLLVDRGYAVLTWDSRGFGQSGGEVNVGAPGFEVRDAQELIDYLATRAEIAGDGPGDPRVGWVGGSNGGGVQINTAAVDGRVDAIVPALSWGDLVQDLLPDGVPKLTWDTVLYGGGMVPAAAAGAGSPTGPQTGAYAEEIHRAYAEVAATGRLSAELQEWFHRRSTLPHAGAVRAPTLLVHGVVDTLFPLEGAFANYLLLSAGTPVKLVAFCGGHTFVGCRYPGGATGYPQGRPPGGVPVWQERTLQWLDRWVKGLAVDTGPAVEWQAQDGVYRGADQWPIPGTATVEGEISTGRLVGPGGTGGDRVATGGPATATEMGRTAARSVVLPAVGHPRAVVGVPAVTLAGRVVGRGAHVYVELVDVAPDGRRVTVNDQTMPVRLPGGTVVREVALHGVAWMVEPGHALELEVTTGSAQYPPPRTGPYAVDLTVRVALPVGPG